jgi:alkylation response protein AidB-like acyl-CoA dehydrogenase
MQVLNVPTPAYLADEEFSMFRNSVGRFLDDNAPPEKFEGWRRAKVVERDLWTKAGAAGLLGLSTSTAYGGRFPPRSHFDRGGGQARHRGLGRIAAQCDRHAVH